MRIANKIRTTKETDIQITLNLDGRGKSKIDTGIGFFDHMLILFAKHSGFDLSVKATGDLFIDNHHTVEDIGIVLGEVFKEALGDKVGIRRYSTFFVPMDDVLARVSVDLGGRSYLSYDAGFTRERIGDFETETLRDFMQSFADNADMNLHIKVLEGDNNHHKAEGIFKAFGRALSEACSVVSDQLPTTKGVL